MFDLEDGVSPDRKGEARDTLFVHLRGSRDREEGGGMGGRLLRRRPSTTVPSTTAASIC